MSTFFFKNLLKCLPTNNPSQLTLPAPEEDHSFNPMPISTTISSKVSNNGTNSILIKKNLNSLYDNSSASTSKSLSIPSLDSSSATSSDTDSDSDSTPDLASVYASQRFFFSSPGRSNSIIDSSKTPIDGGVAIKKYSPNPYADFKRSMLEMIEAKELKDVRANWNYLHELLSCYLSLNPKLTHKYIISAFADIIISLLSSSSPESEIKPTPDEGHRQDEIPRWLV